MNINDIFPIGIGTFKLDLENRYQTVEGLLYSCEMGQNYIDVSSLYASGRVIELLSKFFEKIDRNKIFVCFKISTYIDEISDIEKFLDNYLKVMNIDYVDCLELDEPAFCKISLIDAYTEMKRLVEIGKARYLGISNCNLKILRLVNEKIKIDIFDSLYNLECKVNEDVGILNYCNKNNIKFICYQPLRRNRTANRNYPLLLELSSKYNKTQNQIILNWIVKEKGIVPITKTTNKDRIKENIESLSFDMEKEDYNKLNEFRAEEFDSIEIDWEDKGGTAIDKLPNIFE